MKVKLREVCNFLGLVRLLLLLFERLISGLNKKWVAAKACVARFLNRRKSAPCNLADNCVL